MRWFIALLLYRLILPLLFIAAFPGWLIKMLRRDGLGTGLLERIGIYSDADEFEPFEAVHIHAVSVGETLLALKLIREWRERSPEQAFVVALGTATGHRVATQAGIKDLRVTYAPLDMRWMVRRYLARFQPSKIVLIEGELWPHLLMACENRGIAATLVNARVSPRSARRFRAFAPWIRPLYSRLRAVAIQELQDSSLWRELGVPAERIQHTGSLKFDPGSGEPPNTRPEFASILELYSSGRPLVLAASTHPGENAWIASTLSKELPDIIIAVAPRHAEKRQEVLQELKQAGLSGVLRSLLKVSSPSLQNEVLVIDSTGELKDWTSHADVVIIGKSFLSQGGQNPCEAIQARKPVIFGPHMENFQPLCSKLLDAEGALLACDAQQLAEAVNKALDARCATLFARNASQVLQVHMGATGRIIDLIEGP